MKTQLIHSFSSVSLSGISRSPSSVSLSLNGNLSASQTGLVVNDKSGNRHGNNNNLAFSDSSMNNINDIADEPAEDVNCCTQWARNTCRSKTLYRKLPILEWLPKYDTTKLIADIIAGLTVGLTILPQGLAYATVGGLPPQYGLYSGFIGCFVYIFFGGTKYVTIGPTAVMAIITLSYTSGKPPEFAVVLAFFTGIVTLLMGCLQLGFIVNFISTPVMSGFTSAAALTICSTQVKALLGLNYPAEGFLDVIKGAVTRIDEIKSADLLLSIVCIVALLFMQKLQTIFSFCSKNSPVLDKILWLIATSRSVIVIVVCTVIFTIIGEDTTVAVVGNLTPGLPPFKVPEFTMEFEGTSLVNLVTENISAIIVIPLLAIMEHITIAKAFAGTGRVDASQEMITIGLSNLVGAFFMSMPVTGSFSRTTVNKSSGVASPLGGLLTGVLVILALQFLTPHFYYIPKAGLAAVIVCAVIFTIDLDIVYPMWKSKKMDIIPWALTFVVSLLVGLAIGILCGICVSVIFLLYYSARPGVRVKKGETSTGIEFIMCELDRSLVFPSVEYSRYIIMKSGSVWANNTLPVVVDCHHIQFADYTAAQGMRDMFVIFAERKQELILWRLKPSVLRSVTGVMECSKTPFKYAATEEELERLLEDTLQNTMEKSGTDIKITFTQADEADSETGSDTSSTVERM